MVMYHMTNTNYYFLYMLKIALYNTKMKDRIEIIYYRSRESLLVSIEMFLGDGFIIKCILDR